MRKRPLPIAIIGWFLMISAAFSLYSVLTIQNSPVARDLLAQSGLSLNVHIALGVMGALITVACAWGILKGLDWGRVVYVGWGIIGAIIGFLTSPVPSMILVGLAFLAVFTFFLFRPTANLWFGKTYFGRGNHDAESA